MSALGRGKCQAKFCNVSTPVIENSEPNFRKGSWSCENVSAERQRLRRKKIRKELHAPVPRSRLKPTRRLRLVRVDRMTCRYHVTSR
jgi:hypothetical protein